MDLYFSPLACSMATRIALYEAGESAVYLEVDPKTKVVQNDGSDFRKVNPLGLVPTLRTDDGTVLTENAAILQYVADRFPKAGIGTNSATERSRLHQWLCFVGTELHKGLFVPLFDQKAPEGTHAHTLKKQEPRLKYLNSHLAGRDFLLDRFTVADAYLYTVLNWTAPTRVDLAPSPAIQQYHRRLQKRPSVAKAFQEELALYKAELARHQAGVSLA
jgi:glutathione S-transferase